MTRQWDQYGSVARASKAQRNAFGCDLLSIRSTLKAGGHHVADWVEELLPQLEREMREGEREKVREREQKPGKALL